MAADGLGLEHRLGHAGGLEVLGDEQPDLGLGERPQADADADPLGQGLVPGLGQPVPQQRLAAEHQGERAPPVEVVGGEQAQVLQGIVREQVGLVDDQDDPSRQAAQVAEQGRGGIPLEPPGLQAQGGGDVGDAG